MTNFIAGLRLSAEFFRRSGGANPCDGFSESAVQRSPYWQRIGGLGFDNEMSSDRHWGPRVMLFLREADHARYHEALRRSLSDQLPRTFHGYPTNFTPPNPEDSGCALLCRERSFMTKSGCKRCAIASPTSRTRYGCICWQRAGPASGRKNTRWGALDM